ncbi:MAG TPA: hypothetical protein VH087_17450 [Thermoanaerobaculia bacterium]|jgi:hypothetical protein|nr:hypothetical protein [Thermoanaerobaculia bacterium]
MSQLNAAAADTPQAPSTLTAEALIEQLRSLNGQIPAVTPMTAQERRFAREASRTSQPVLKASISVIGAENLVSQVVGHQPNEVQDLCDDSVRWSRVEDELRAMLNGVTGANLVRRQRLSVIANRAYGVGSQLAKSPEYASLVPHVEEVKRLRKLERRKKPAATPQTPSPAEPKA